MSEEVREEERAIFRSESGSVSVENIMDPDPAK